MNKRINQLTNISVINELDSIYFVIDQWNEDLMKYVTLKISLQDLIEKLQSSNQNFTGNINMILPTYNNNTEAVTDGMELNDLYKDEDGFVRIVL